MAILHEVSTRSERAAVTADHCHTAITCVKQVTSHDAVVGAAIDLHAVVAKVSRHAVCDAIARATAYFNGVASSGFKNQVAERNVRDIFKMEQWLIDQRKHRFSGLVFEAT